MIVRLRWKVSYKIEKVESLYLRERGETSLYDCFRELWLYAWLMMINILDRLIFVIDEIFEVENEYNLKNSHSIWIIYYANNKLRFIKN